MEPWLIILIGTVVCGAGILGSIHYRKVHKHMFAGSVFEKGPPEFLLLPLWGFAGIGAVFVLMGIFR